jgi:hypothetical protein
MSFFSRFSSGISSLVENAGLKDLVESAAKTVSDAAQAFSLDALQDGTAARRSLFEGLDVTYLTPRLIAMTFPTFPDSKIRSRNDAGAIKQLLEEQHGEQYMIWNCSEESYDAAFFGGRVIDVRFPGYPAPPVEMLFRVCLSVENWLQASDKNVAVIHCMTGKGRTCCIAACALAWLAEFSSPLPALAYVCERRSSDLRALKARTGPPAHGPVAGLMLGVTGGELASPPPLDPVAALLCPSQQRYVQYFALACDGVKPRSGIAAPLILRRVLVQGAPPLERLPLGRRTRSAAGAAHASGEVARAVTRGDASGSAAEPSARPGEAGLEPLIAGGRPAAALAETAAGALPPQPPTAAATLSLSPDAAAPTTASSSAELAAAQPTATPDAADLAVAASGGAVEAQEPKTPPQSFSSALGSELREVQHAAATVASSILSTLTDVAASAVAAGTSEAAATAAAGGLPAGQVGYRPSLQIFRGGRLVHSTLWEGETESAAASTAGTGHPSGDGWISVEEGAARFNMAVPLAGDALVRCRHVAASGERETLWRAAFHTGYVQRGSLRLSKRQLDMGCDDPRLPEGDSFVELFFAPVEVGKLGSEKGASGAPAAAAAGEGGSHTADEHTAAASSESTVSVPAAASSSGAAPEVEGTVHLGASDGASFERSGAAEDEFWERIAEKRRAAVARAAAARRGREEAAAVSPDNGGTALPGQDVEPAVSGVGPTLDAIIRNPPPLPPTRPANASAAAASRPAVDAVEGLSAGGAGADSATSSGTGHAVISMSASGKSDGAGASTAAQGIAAAYGGGAAAYERDLADLEELERELGIAEQPQRAAGDRAGFSVGSPAAPPTPADSTAQASADSSVFHGHAVGVSGADIADRTPTKAVGPAVSAADDVVDELEKYLAAQ